MIDNILLTYLIGVVVSFVLFYALNVRYYQMSMSEYISRVKPLVIFSLVWPAALPSFIYHYWNPIISVLKGNTWEPSPEIKKVVNSLTEEEMVLLLKKLEGIEENTVIKKDTNSNKRLN